MKYLSALTLIFCLSFSVSSHAIIKGLNYDPAHTKAFIDAQQNNKLDQMTALINADLAKIKRMGFTTIKTFYSKFCTVLGQCVLIADLANKNNLNVLLGVYEFPEAPIWTVGQVEAAIESANKYPQLVVGIVVGNEDAFDAAGTPRPVIQLRIINDIKDIRKGVRNKSLLITTAQREPDWYALGKSDPLGLLNVLTVVGANIYPFWGGSPEKVKGTSVANTIPATVNKIKLATKRGVIVTEEGWPSCGNNPNTQDKNLPSEIDYYQTWKARADNFDSYYFAAFDNYTVRQCPQDDANNNFGLCYANGTTKSLQLINCAG